MRRFLSIFLSRGEMHGLSAASFHKVTISSQSEEQAFIDAWELELTCLVDGPRTEFKATLVLNHRTCK